MEEIPFEEKDRSSPRRERERKEKERVSEERKRANGESERTRDGHRDGRFQCEEDLSTRRSAAWRGVARRTRSNLQEEEGKKWRGGGGGGPGTASAFRMTRLLGVAEIIDEPVTRTGATRGLNNVFQPLKSP